MDLEAEPRITLDGQRSALPFRTSILSAPSYWSRVECPCDVAGKWALAFGEPDRLASGDRKARRRGSGENPSAGESVFRKASADGGASGTRA